MIKLSFSELALPIIGFFLGAAFIIMVYRMLDSGRGRRHDRYHRGGNRYYDDDDDRGNYLPFILVLFVVCGAVLSYKFDLFRIQKDLPLSKQNLEIKVLQPREKDDVPTEEEMGIEERNDHENQPHISEIQPSENEDELYCIRVCVLSKRQNVEPCILDLMDKGLSAFTRERDNGTAIYVGPFESRDRAKDVNLDKNLEGTIEPYDGN